MYQSRIHSWCPLRLFASTAMLSILLGLSTSLPATAQNSHELREAAEHLKQASEKIEHFVGTPAEIDRDSLAIPSTGTDQQPTEERNVGLGTLMASLTIFVLAIFVGFELITKVPPTLHTPLMSGSNAISGITIVGAVLSAGIDEPIFAAILGLIAVALAAINVVGGFMVTDRMLSMFQRR
ncbi:MAG: NAD(P) transhydrogenase subunit alpha [Pirellulaceae bacterium]